jgi:hypothetical protein
MLLTDFHVHSTFSDGKLTIPELVDLYGSYGFGAIAITDHLCEEKTVIGKASAYLGCTLTRETFDEYIATIDAEAERAWRQYGMLVLPGFELTKNSVLNHRSAHIVALGVRKFISADQRPTELARQIREQGGLSIAAHPVWTRAIERQTYFLWDRREELCREFDAWEVASGGFLFEEVAKTKLPKIANSDLHHPRHLRSWKTLVDSEKHPQAVLQAIRKQNLRFRFFNPALGKPPPPLRRPPLQTAALAPLAVWQAQGARIPLVVNY